MNDKKMILFYDYVEDKEELKNVINDLVKRFLKQYPVELQEITLSFAPNFDNSQRFESVEIIVK